MFHISVGDTGFLHQKLLDDPFFKRINGIPPVWEFKDCCARLGSLIEVKVISVKPWTSNLGERYGTFARETIKVAFSRSEDDVYLPFSEELLRVGMRGKRFNHTWTIIGKQFTPKRDGYV